MAVKRNSIDCFRYFENEVKILRKLIILEINDS